MPKFEVASHFSLHSVDHDRVLLDESNHNARNLLGESSLPKELKLSFTVNGEKREANLFRELGAFTDEVKVTTLDEKGEYQSVPLQGEHFAYYSEDRSWVLTFHGDEKFDGLVFEEGGSKIHHFIGKEGKMTVDGNVRDYFPGGMKTEGRKLTSEAQNGIDYWSGCHGAQSSGLGQMNIGAAIGTVMVKNFGVNRAIAEYNSYMTLTNMIYERQMDIRLKIDEFFVAENANEASWAQSSCGQQSIQTQLNNMRYWNPPSEQVIWHLLDDCFGFSGGVLGIAYLGTLCSFNNVGVNLYSDDVYTSTEYPTWATVAHEIGHNFDAQHSFEDGQGKTGGIMDYGFLSGKLINGEVQFNTEYRRTEVCREVNSANNRGCIIKGVAPSPTGQFTVPEPVESLLEAPRELSCAKHRLRVHNDAAALRAIVDANSEEECKTACAERAECNAFSVDKDNYCQLYQGATEQGLAFSSKFTTFLCAEGEVPVSFTEQEVDDALEGANLSSLKEECCASTADATFLGMNMNSERSMNKEDCENACIQNSRCEATSFDAVSGCMMYGGREFTHQKVAHQGSSVLSCDRPCISAVVGEPASAEVASNSAAIIGSVLVAVGFVGALVGGVFYYKKRKSTETVATEGAALKATL